MKDQKSGGRRTGKGRLDALVEEAIVDCYDESEQAMGLFAMLEQHLKLPFVTRVLGVEVTVEEIDVTDRDEIVAICERDGERQSIRLADLPLPEPPPEGAEWIEAYRHWAGWR